MRGTATAHPAGRSPGNALCPVSCPRVPLSPHLRHLCCGQGRGQGHKTVLTTPSGEPKVLGVHPPSPSPRGDRASFPGTRRRPVRPACPCPRWVSAPPLCIACCPGGRIRSVWTPHSIGARGPEKPGGKEAASGQTDRQTDGHRRRPASPPVCGPLPSCSACRSLGPSASHPPSLPASRVSIATNSGAAVGTLMESASLVLILKKREN